MMHDIVGYVYEGGVHCQMCTAIRFHNSVGIDREGNEVSVYDENDAEQSDSDTSCEDCHELLWDKN